MNRWIGLFFCFPFFSFADPSQKEPLNWLAPRMEFFFSPSQPKNLAMDHHQSGKPFFLSQSQLKKPDSTKPLKPALSFSPNPFSQKELSNQNTAKLISSYSQIKKGHFFPVGLWIKIPPGWHSYWSFPGDFGQAPQIQWEPIDHVQIKPLPFPSPYRKEISINKKPAYSFIYESELLIPFQVFIEEGYNKDHLPLSLNLKWFICKELCLFKTASLQLNLKIGPDFKTNQKSKKVFDSWQVLFPKKLNLKSLFKVKDKSLIVNFFFEKEIKCKDVFPSRNVDFSTKLPVLLTQTSKHCSFQIQKSSSQLKKIFGLLIYSQKGERGSAVFQSNREEGLDILWFILMAFLGGLILNIMPCVLPLIFLKFYSLMELKHLPSKKILHLNLSYAMGVIVSFLFLAFIIFISKRAGESLGWGFHLQSPVFVAVLALLFILMAFYLLNFISFSFPKVSLLFKNEKAFSHFVTGILSTTAASPCTVPFMVSAVGFAFSRSSVEIFIIFLFLGLGLSFPYLALSFFPGALKYIPAPGRWAEILKKLFSIPLFLTALWLFRILYLQVDFKVFLFSLILFPLALAGVLSQARVKRQSLKKTLILIFSVLFLVFFTAQKLLHDFLKKDQLTVKGQAQKSFQKDLNWINFNKQQVLFDKQSGKNIFIVFGASWCLTCKLNERIFKKQEFKDIIQQNQIQLYYGDWTSQNPEITKFFKSYSQPGVPFYIFFKGEEELFIFPNLLFQESFFEKLKKLSH